MHFLRRNVSMLLSLIILAGAASGANANPTVTIPSGVIIGTATKVSNQPTVSALVKSYLGIPFAAPPQRFSPPTPPKAWATPLRAQNVPPACVQQFTGTGDVQSRTKEYFNNPGYAPPPENEDCLYLNVYAPAGATPNNTKPVLFWLFGGNLQFGTGSLTYYSGSSLAATQDVVLVTINYRTNIFGFSNSPEIPFGAQNSGFLDQRLALAWVQQNIAYFGGDPSKVTLFGQSAGGESVKQLLAHPPQPLPFHGAILQSQGSNLHANGLASYNQTAAYFNCSAVSSPITCLRRVPAANLKAYIEHESLVFPPVDADGTSISDVRPAISSGTFAKVPLLIGYTAQDASVFLAVEGLSNSSAVLDSVLALLGLNNSASVNTIVNTYGDPVVSDAYTLASRLLTDAIFTCPTAALSTYLNLNGYPVWRYVYSAAFPNTRIFTPPKDGGAYHTSEIPEVFGTFPLRNARGPATKQQIELSAYMQGVWAGWAKSPASGPGWPRVGTNLGTVVGNLGANGSSGEHTDNILSTDYPCPLLTPASDLLGFLY